MDIEDTAFILVVSNLNAEPQGHITTLLYYTTRTFRNCLHRSTCMCSCMTLSFAFHFQNIPPYALH